MKKALLIILSFIFLIVAVSVTVSEINYSSNIKAEKSFANFEDGYINSQGSTNEFNYGFFHSRYNGCGWIATFNVCKYLGIEVSISEIIRAYDLYGTNFFGSLGTNPFAIMWYLQSKGLNVGISAKSEKFDELARNSDVSIFVYYGFQGGHYQMLVPTTDNMYTFYNPLETHTMQQNLDSVKDYYTALIYIKN